MVAAAADADADDDDEFAVVDFPNLRAVDVIEEARQRILSTFRAYTTGLILASYSHRCFIDLMPSVLGHCCLGDRKDIRPVKTCTSKPLGMS